MHVDNMNDLLMAILKKGEECVALLCSKILFEERL